MKLFTFALVAFVGYGILSQAGVSLSDLIVLGHQIFNAVAAVL